MFRIYIFFVCILCLVASKMSWMMRNLSNNNMDFSNTDALKNVCLQQTSYSLLTSCLTIHCKRACLCWWSIWMFQSQLAGFVGSTNGTWRFTTSESDFTVALLRAKGRNGEFDIQRGVRQGCVLSSNFFGFVLEWRMAASIFWSFCIRAWYSSINNISREVAFLLDEVVRQLFQVALIPNANNMQTLTTHVQPPKAITTGNGSSAEFIDKKSSHKCPGYFMFVREQTWKLQAWSSILFIKSFEKHSLQKKKKKQYHNGPRQLKLSEQRCNSALLARCVVCG